MSKQGKIVKGNCEICGRRIESYSKSVRIYCSPACKYQGWKKKSPEKYIKMRERQNKKRDRHAEYLKSKERHLISARKSEVKRYFGGNYDKVLKRDNATCVVCGMTQKEHYDKYNRNIEMHHIDCNKDNCEEKNLQVLCKACHDRIHNNLNK